MSFMAGEFRHGFEEKDSDRVHCYYMVRVRVIVRVRVRVSVT
jgi:hypothetical protein